MLAEATHATPLPTIVAIIPGEALDGYLERVADANYVTTAYLVSLIRNASDTLRYLSLAPSVATVDAIAALTGQQREILRRGTLSTYDHGPLDLTGFEPSSQSGHRSVAARGWFPGRGTQICPECLADDGIWCLTWRLPTTTVCRVHRVYLVSTCPGCHRPFRDQRHSPLRVVGTATRCGNPIGQGPRKQCPVDLAALPTTPAAPSCLARQERHDLAASGAKTRTAVGGLDPANYIATSRSLAVLLLHIATATSDPSRLPEWASTLRPGTTARTKRWGIRPPRDPALRSRALTMADIILTADDLDAAVECFVPWLDSLPDLPEGRLGWLADHTHMTPSLTRLIMASHAPRRRLSRLLDDSVPMTTSSRQIPQVLPTELINAHLAGLFTSRPATIGLFASLCLARTHPQVTTWGNAAGMLGLEPSLGERTARACSAAMIASAHQVVDALAAAAKDLDVDVRDIERQVAQLVPTTRWFTRWAKEDRPGTRTASHPYAVHWLWTHIANGHPSASPVHVAPAAARKFTGTLSGDQRTSLIAAASEAGEPTLRELP